MDVLLAAISSPEYRFLARDPVHENAQLRMDVGSLEEFMREIRDGEVEAVVSGTPISAPAASHEPTTALSNEDRRVIHRFLHESSSMKESACVTVASSTHPAAPSDALTSSSHEAASWRPGFIDFGLALSHRATYIRAVPTGLWA